MPDTDVLIIGSGLAGLCCARHLHDRGVSFQLLEAGDGVGGRVRTDEVDGFLLDRGFQVLLTAYPEAQRMLDYEALDLKPFYNGASVYYAVRFRRVADPTRHPRDVFSTLFSGIGSFGDKWRVLRMRNRVTSGSLEALFEQPELTTRAALKDRWGFSDAMIERFFRPFLGGILLDDSLNASSRMSEFVLRMFAEGEAVVPAAGIEVIPRQLASGLPTEAIFLNTAVASIAPDHVVLAEGKTRSASHIVVATEGPSAAALLDELDPPGSRRVTCLYYAAERAPETEPILMLDGIGAGPANNVAVMSRVAPSYAPNGAELISVTVLGNEAWSDEELDKGVRAQMVTWFGDDPFQWRHLRTYRIPHAQPDQTPPALSPPQRPVRLRKGLYVCGDHRTNASINGAMTAGRVAAEAVMQDLT